MRKDLSMTGQSAVELTAETPLAINADKASVTAAASGAVKVDAKEHIDYEACIKKHLEKLKSWYPKAEELALIESNLRDALNKKLVTVVELDQFDYFLDYLAMKRVFGTDFGFTAFQRGCFTLAEIRLLDNPTQHGVLVGKNIELLNGKHAAMYARFKTLQTQQSEVSAAFSQLAAAGAGAAASGAVKVDAKEHTDYEACIKKQLEQLKNWNPEAEELALIETNLRDALDKKLVTAAELNQLDDFWSGLVMKRVFGTNFGFTAFQRGCFTLAEIRLLDNPTQHDVLVGKNIELLNGKHAAMYARFKALQTQQPALWPEVSAAAVAPLPLRSSAAARQVSQGASAAAAPAPDRADNWVVLRDEDGDAKATWTNAPRYALRGGAARGAAADYEDEPNLSGGGGAGAAADSTASCLMHHPRGLTSLRTMQLAAFAHMGARASAAGGGVVVLLGGMVGIRSHRAVYSRDYAAMRAQGLMSSLRRVRLLDVEPRDDVSSTRTLKFD